MRNPLKERLARGEHCVGAWLLSGSMDSAEIMGGVGFDWLLLDGEHTPMSLETMQRLLQALNGSRSVPIVRPQWNDPVIIKRVLDVGAYGVLVPWVNSREEAEKAVAACRYPPEGIRGWGPRRASRGDPDYRATANDAILVAVQIETEEAIKNLDEIASVDGVDVLYVGPNDLSNNMGLGLPVKWENPRFLGALEAVLDACENHGKAAGLFCNKENIQWAHKKGFIFNTVGDDDGFLLAGAREGLARALGG